MFAPAPQGPPPGSIVMNPVRPMPPGAIIMNPVDTRTPQEKQKEELAKFGALVGLAGNVAGMIPGLQPLRYAGDIFNLIT